MTYDMVGGKPHKLRWFRMNSYLYKAMLGPFELSVTRVKGRTDGDPMSWHIDQILGSRAEQWHYFRSKEAAMRHAERTAKRLVLCLRETLKKL